jgi:hypothetical protein
MLNNMEILTITTTLTTMLTEQLLSSVLIYVSIFVTNRFLAMEHTKNPSIYLWKLISSEQRYGYNSAIY